MNTLVSNHAIPAASGASWFAPIRNTFANLAAAARAAEHFKRLSGLSDQQLAQRGLRRTEIAQHVAQDYIGDIASQAAGRRR